MAKPGKTTYVCSACGAASLKWQGQCPECDAWNTLEERAPAPTGQRLAPVRPVDLAELSAEAESRFATGFSELDRVLGGGVMPGAVILLGGDPGVGKSTLLQQAAAALARDLTVCYATGEESRRQVGQRAQRLGLADSRLCLLADTDLDNVLEQAAAVKAAVVVVDSIQTMATRDLPSAPGSVAQLRECVGRVVQFAKSREVAFFLIGHVTKEGAIAGPRVVEHMVDTVLYFENDPGSRYSVIRAVKNRFGAASEMGVFAMTAAGFREVKNPSAIFLSGTEEGAPGSVVSVAWEGSRPLLVEIQSLVVEAAGGHPRRLAQGFDTNRLALLVAVLQRHGGLSLAGQDVFVNVVGGLRIGETAADLPALLAAVSSFRDRPCRGRLVSFGEVGLTGEVRPVRFGAERIAEAARQGFRHAVVPRANVPKPGPEGIEVTGIGSLSEALAAAFD